MEDFLILENKKGGQGRSREREEVRKNGRKNWVPLWQENERKTKLSEREENGN